MEHIQEKQPPDVITSDTDNQTKIDPSEAPPGQREKYRTFRAYNTGLWNGPRRENKPAMRRQDNLHRFDAIAPQLNLTDYQKTRGRRVFDSLNISSFCGSDDTADMVIWAICTIVANADVHNGTRYWPHSQAESNDHRFREVAEEFGMDLSKQMSVLQRVMSQTEV